MNKTQLELLVDRLTKENRALEDNVIRLFKNVSTLENTVSTLEKKVSDKDTAIIDLANYFTNEQADFYSKIAEVKKANNFVRERFNNLQDEYEDSLLNIELLNKEIATLQENDLDDLYLASLDEIQKLNLKILKLKKKNRKLKK